MATKKENPAAETVEKVKKTAEKAAEGTKKTAEKAVEEAIAAQWPPMAAAGGPLFSGCARSRAGKG